MYIRHYGAMHLEKLPANAILIVKGDVITNSIRYLQRCEGMWTCMHMYIYVSLFLSLSLSLFLSL